MILLKRFFQAIVLIILLGFLCISCLKRSAGKSFVNNKANFPYDAIIVPGFPYEDEEWHIIMKMRVHWSHYLHSNGFVKKVIYSGAAVYSPYVESKIMKEYAMALGIPEEDILTDTLAEHSTENLYYSHRLARKNGLEKIALATDPVQNFALRRFARKNDIEVDFLPIVFDTLETLQMHTPNIDPSRAFVKDFTPLTEKESFFERLRGTMGKEIDPDVYK
ncbi:YdcF family protein [Cytophagaceae bacterium ABcell3]|nr:YdcF family protein [Cytophagaceae bacterium ABcell3]